MTGTLICTGVASFALGLFVCERSRCASLREVAEERERQIIELNYDAKHDDALTDDELIQMASAYLHPDEADEWWPYEGTLPPSLKLTTPACPEGIPAWLAKRRRHLVIAASLVCAEIDRMDRNAKALRRMSERQFQLLWLIALVGLGLLAGVR